MKQSNTVLTQLNQQPVQPAPKPSVLFKVITTILAFSLSVAWIFLSKLYFSKQIKNIIFTKNPLKTLDNSVNLLADIGFYAAIYMISLTFTVMLIRILNHSVNPAVTAPLEPAEKLNQLIRSFTQSLIIFACLFLYFLENSKNSAKSSFAFILPVWFLSGYVALWVGNLLELLFKRDIGFSKLGQFVVFWTFVVLLAQIAGFKLFALI